MTMQHSVLLTGCIALMSLAALAMRIDEFKAADACASGRSVMSRQPAAPRGITLSHCATAHLRAGRHQPHLAARVRL